MSTGQEAPSPPSRKPTWVLPTVALLGIVTATSLGVAAWALLRPDSDGGAGPGAAATTAISPLLAAHRKCHQLGELSDGNQTLFLDMKGEDPGSGTLSYTQVTCYLRELGAPDYVTTHMDQTRALDGRQSDSWGEFEASWTYHPDDGLDILIRLVG